eukprot:349702-Chlamydomonas_euryale.AAC.9
MVEKATALSKLYAEMRVPASKIIFRLPAVSVRGPRSSKIIFRLPAVSVRGPRSSKIIFRLPA